MSQEQFNELVKRMLDFGHPLPEKDVQKDTKENGDNIVVEQGKINDISLPVLEQGTTQLPRKNRRAQERVAKRLEKLKKSNIKKEELNNDVKSRLEKAKEEVKEEIRKSQFSNDDRTRIERVLFNKTN